MENPFKPKTKEDIKREAQEKEELAKKIAQVGENARACLNSFIFAKYKESVKEAREGLITLMKKNTEPDPVKFALFAKACLAKIDAWDQMVEEVERDSKKGVKE